MTSSGTARRRSPTTGQRPRPALLLFVALDALELGVEMLDPSGRSLHRSRRFDDLAGGAAAAEAEAHSALTLFEERMLARLRSGVRQVVERPELIGRADLDLGGARCRARGLAVAWGDSGEDAALLVTLERLGAEVEPLPAALRLTTREERVARMLAEGCTNKEIAAALGIRPTTAKNHTQSVLRKLGVRRRGQVGPLLRKRART